MQGTMKREWRNFWYLPVAAAVGYSTAVLHTYGLGLFIAPLEAEFGWSRSSISAGISIAGVIGAVFSIPLGMAVDRIGPRIVAFIGVVLMTGGFALLGTVSGQIWQWYLVWALVGVGNVFLQATVWTSAVATRFEASRGLAIAVTLSGAAITATILPIIATWLIGAYGWRAGFAGIGLAWAVAVLPVLFYFFRSDEKGASAMRSPGKEPPGAGSDMSEALASPGFYQLLLASGFFTITGIGVIVHFVPILLDRGAEPLSAAGVATLIGLFSVVGRLGTGLLLDRFRPNIVGAFVFVMPLVACLFLLFAGHKVEAQTVAAACFGFALGAEIDVIAFLVSRCFGLRSYGTIFGAMVGAMALGSAAGPYVAGVIHDSFDSYVPFLIGSVTMLGISALSLTLLKVPPAS